MSWGEEGIAEACVYWTWIVQVQRGNVRRDVSLLKENLDV